MGLPRAGKRRAIVEDVRPSVDCGRYPAKAVTGDQLIVTADVFADGHDMLRAVVRYAAEGEQPREAEMEPLVNDRWRGSFPIERLGPHNFSVRAWVDRLSTWHRDVHTKIAAGLDVSVELLEGAELIERAARRAKGDDARALKAAAARMRKEPAEHLDEVLTPEVLALARRHPDRSNEVASEEMKVFADRPRARFSSWYEMFPRSASNEPGRQGTFADVEARLPYVARMGFDVLYLPPIHPIGRTYRKGANNDPNGTPGSVGSPWAIGSEEGGHRSIHPDLGTLDDFTRLLGTAQQYGLELALDLAFQCSPDHPWVAKHPEWFRHRPDGTIQYAENPPKKYQDIYPLDFETPAWQELWTELRAVVQFWLDHGVRIFRVDNPHTKSFRFWEWLIDDVKRDYPETIFLAEAFTRPKAMYRLAKIGFTQSYTYFTWRRAKWELEQYFTELTQTEAADFFRPNLWPNTPDILTDQLQHDGRPQFVARLILAATLGASYGIYGPAFELMEHLPIEEGREEYLHSEKYEIRQWDLDRVDSLSTLIGLVNQIRKDNPALQRNDTLRFQWIENERIIAYTKADPAHDNLILTLVNLDPRWSQSGWVRLPLHDLGLPPGQFEAHDLLTGARFTWSGEWNYVELHPHVMPAHVLRLGAPPHTEDDFEPEP